MAKTCSPQGTGRAVSPAELAPLERGPPQESGDYRPNRPQESGDYRPSRLPCGAIADACRWGPGTPDHH